MFFAFSILVILPLLHTGHETSEFTRYLPVPFIIFVLEATHIHVVRIDGQHRLRSDS